MALIGEGSQLYTMQLWDPGYMEYWEPESTNGRDPATPPRFLLDGIPEELDDRIIGMGGGGLLWDLLEEAGVTEVQWRQSLKHLEVNFWSEDVYNTMKQILGEQLTYRRTFLFTHYLVGTRRYYQYQIELWPGRRALAEPKSFVPWIVPEMCVPTLDVDARFGSKVSSAVNALKGQDVTLAIPKWSDQGSKRVISFNSTQMVTEDFVERWQSTDISKHLREENWENDIGFVPTNFGFHRDHQVNYKWVDAPMPEDVQP